jgi:hypothetical protein
MIKLEIIDLPKGYNEFIHRPYRPTSFVVRRKGATSLEQDVIRCDVQSPLILQVGDVVEFEEGPLPRELFELTRTDTGHGIYAVITTQGPAPQAARGEEATGRRKSRRNSVEFVGQRCR